MFRPALSRSAIVKAAHARVAASRAFLADLAAKGFSEPANTLRLFDYRREFARALSNEWARAKLDAESAADPLTFAAAQRAYHEATTDGLLRAA